MDCLEVGIAVIGVRLTGNDDFISRLSFGSVGHLSWWPQNRLQWLLYNPYGQLKRN